MREPSNGTVRDLESTGREPQEIQYAAGAIKKSYSRYGTPGDRPTLELSSPAHVSTRPRFYCAAGSCAVNHGKSGTMCSTGHYAKYC